MSYTIYDNTGSSSSYSANPNDPIPSSQVIDGSSQASWAIGGKKGNDFELEIGGNLFDDWTEGISGNTYTFVDGTTAVGSGDTVEVKYDKDDDGSGQDIDVVSIDLGGFDASFELDIKSAQTADRLYLSNVLSFQVAGEPVVNGSLSYPDSNNDLFGEETFRVFEDKSEAATITYLDANGNTQTITMTLGGGGATEMEVMVDFICFARGTLIETDKGPTAIEDMMPGDLVKTKDNGFQRVEWISSRKLTGQDLKRMPHLRPIRFRKGALGDNMPNADLLVSPQHRMLLGDWRCEMLFAANEVLAPSKALVNDRDIVTDYSDDGVEYFHFMCSKHEIVYANGIESESFHPGEFGASTLDADAREELYVLFPQLRGGLDTYGQTARRTLKVFEARLLADPK